MNYTIRIKKFIIYSINVGITIIEGFLLFRLVLKLLGANTSPFVNWIYEVSDGILTPFQGMFASFVSAGGNVLEFTTIFTIAFYGLMYYFIYQLVNLLADVIQRTSPSSKTTQTQGPPPTQENKPI